MKLREIASVTGIKELKLQVATDAQNNPTDWLRHWENSERIAISVHKDLVAEIKANPNLDLDLDKEIRVGPSGEDYTAYRIVKAREYEERIALV